MNLKLNQTRERNTADLKIYSQLPHLKNIDKFDFQGIEIWYLFQHEGKNFIVLKVLLFLILEDLLWYLVTGPVFAQHQVSTDLNKQSVS